MTDDPMVSSQRALAKLVGVSPSAIRKWMARPDWPSYWSLPLPARLVPFIDKWRRENLGVDNSADWRLNR